MISKITVLLSIGLLLNSCASKELVRYEDGEAIATQQNLKRTPEPSRIEVTFHEVELNTPQLKISVAKNESVKEEWEDIYSQVGVYNTRCKGWRLGTSDPISSNQNKYCDFNTQGFLTLHLLLVGFFYDLYIPFQSYDERTIETKEPISDLRRKPESKEVDVRTPVPSGTIRLTIDQKSAASRILDGVAGFDFKALALSSKALPESAKVVVDFGGEQLDVSAEFADFVGRIKEEKKLALAEKLRAEHSDSTLNMSDFSKRDELIRVLIKVPGESNLNRFDRETLYFMKNFRLVQRVPGGYFITANQVGLGGSSVEFGMAYLKTKKNFPSDVLITGVTYFSGAFKYTALSGFEENIPLLEIPTDAKIAGIHSEGDPFKTEEY